MVLLFYRGARDAPAQRGIFLFPDARRRFRIAGCRTLSRIFCLRRPHFFQQRKKWGKERRQKPVVFGFPFGRFRCGGKRFRRESAMGLPPLPLTWRAGTIGSSIALSDYQIAHLPSIAASVGAARWAAQIWQNCAAAHFRVKAAARRGAGQFNISDESAHGGKRRKEIQKPLVFGGVLSPISSAVGRNGAAGGIKTDQRRGAERPQI